MTLRLICLTYNHNLTFIIFWTLSFIMDNTTLSYISRRTYQWVIVRSKSKKGHKSSNEMYKCHFMLTRCQYSVLHGVLCARCNVLIRFRRKFMVKTIVTYNYLMSRYNFFMFNHLKWNDDISIHQKL